jgi:hypothetical protein
MGRMFKVLNLAVEGERDAKAAFGLVKKEIAATKVMKRFTRATAAQQPRRNWSWRESTRASSL